MKKALVFDRAKLRDQIMGCWLGKNAGGTLGEPLEGKFGQDEMFDIDWYPVLEPGGIPNDDLEMQLIWLQTLVGKGPGITSEDLVQAWLDCVAYNFDEYGLSKTNMKKGLLPPVCGWHNNIFRDCMGSPIRSEIWACVAPGCPDIAARYAFYDAICDHGGGESVYGEMYNAAVQSAAFVESDPLKLIRLALSAIPEDSLTARAIMEAVDLYKAGVYWKDARNILKQHFYNPVAQYSPLNLGFQTIGWLYGENFGDALCKAVNCGWDTDCTAATLGATLGILQGASGLPEKWISPLGDTICTNMRTGGIRNLSAPTNIAELTDLALSQAEHVLRFWGIDARFEEADLPIALPDKVNVDFLVDYRPNALFFKHGGIEETLCYEKDAAILGNRASVVTLILRNPRPESVSVTATPVMPEGFRIEPRSFSCCIKPGEFVERKFTVSASAAYIRESNTGWIQLSIEKRPAVPSLPLVFIGGVRWLISPLFVGKKLDDDCDVIENQFFVRPPDAFEDVWRGTNDLEISDRFTEDGVLYLLHQLYSETEQKVVVGVPNNGRMRVFLNGVSLHTTSQVVPLRANQGNGGANGDLSNYKTTVLEKGWNQFLIKLERVHAPQEAHFTLGGIHPSCVKNHGETVLDICQSCFIWEKG